VEDVKILLIQTLQAIQELKMGFLASLKKMMEQKDIMRMVEVLELVLLVN